MNFPRKRPQSQGGSNNSNNQRRRSFSNNGGGQSHSNNNGGGNRPRKNYGAMREKYLTQARDALSSGDRVLAENYFQHADHCFRMIAEENANRPQRAPQQHHNEQNQEPQVAENASEAPAENATETTQENSSESSEGDDSINLNVSSLPAFLTSSYTPPKVEGAQATPQNWEE